MITAPAGGCTHSSWNTLDSLSNGYVTTRMHHLLGKKGERRNKREREKGQSVESRMPQNATKARKILYGPGGTDWTGPMAHGQRGTVTRDTCVDQRMRVFRGVVCLNAVMSLVINMYLCVYVCVCTYSWGGWGGKDISTSNYNPLSWHGIRLLWRADIRDAAGFARPLVSPRNDITMNNTYYTDAR